MRWASAGGHGNGRRGGCRCCPHPRRCRRHHRHCSVPYLGEASCAIRPLVQLRRPRPRGAGWGLGRPTGSPDGRVLYGGGGREDGLLPLALALPIALPFPLPLGRGRGGGFCQVSGASWKPKGLRLSPRDRKPRSPPPRLIFWDGTERARHLPKDAQHWGGGITWGER